jgi:hypothetical protein
LSNIVKHFNDTIHTILVSSLKFSEEFEDVLEDEQEYNQECEKDFSKIKNLKLFQEIEFKVCFLQRDIRKIRAYL